MARNAMTFDAAGIGMSQERGQLHMNTNVKQEGITLKTGQSQNPSVTLKGSQNIYSVSKTLIGLARNETNDELLFPRLDFFFPRPKGGPRP